MAHNYISQVNLKENTNQKATGNSDAVNGIILVFPVDSVLWCLLLCPLSGDSPSASLFSLPSSMPLILLTWSLLPGLLSSVSLPESLPLRV